MIKTTRYGWISVACEKAAEDQARFKTEWPWVPFETPNGGKSALTTGKIIVFENDAKFQNGFGAMERVVISCEYDLYNDTATATIMEK